jgi:hypothetical protein
MLVHVECSGTIPMCLGPPCIHQETDDVPPAVLCAPQIYTAAGWGGAPTTCAQGELAHACSTRKLLRKLLGMMH